MQIETQYLSVKSVAKRYDCSAPTIWRLTREGKFPKPVKPFPGSTRWRLSDLQEWDKLRVGAA